MANFNSLFTLRNTCIITCILKLECSRFPLFIIISFVNRVVRGSRLSCDRQALLHMRYMYQMSIGSRLRVVRETVHKHFYSAPDDFGDSRPNMVRDTMRYQIIRQLCLVVAIKHILARHCLLIRFMRQQALETVGRHYCPSYERALKAARRGGCKAHCSRLTAVPTGFKFSKWPLSENTLSMQPHLDGGK